MIHLALVHHLTLSKWFREGISISWLVISLHIDKLSINNIDSWKNKRTIFLIACKLFSKISIICVKFWHQSTHSNWPTTCLYWSCLPLIIGDTGITICLSYCISASYIIFLNPSLWRSCWLLLTDSKNLLKEVYLSS